VLALSLQMNLLNGARAAIVLVCAGAIVFLLRVLFAFLEEERRARRELRSEVWQAARRNRRPQRRRETLIVVDAETLKRRFTWGNRKSRLLAGAVVLAMSISELKLWR
jgi:hypothetical protein